MLVFIAVTSGTALLLPALQAMGTPGLSPTQAVLLINREKANVVDVRSAEEFASGHLIGSKHVAVDQISTDLTKAVPDKKKTVAACLRQRHAFPKSPALGFANGL